MFKRKLAKVIVSLLRRIANVSRAGAKRLMRAMLRSLMAMGRRAKLPVAGFVLPTVTMVMLVVVLLTLAITLRSFDRAQNARNVRVNQAVLAAASPALDRAKAKINFLLKEDPQRPTATPSDNEMYRIISASDTLAQTPPRDLYTFGDETRLRLRYDLDNNGAIVLNNNTSDPDNAQLEDNEAINTAWRYAVDTDNNGKFDTYTIYGIFFRSPPRNPGTGNFERARKPLESRTPPMPAKLSDPACAGAVGTSASLVGDSGWYKSEGRLKKSFFVYTVNLPITQAGAIGLDTDTFEAFKGTTSFSALEYQQDQSRIPLSNNAVVYEDDLEISAFPPLTINGRIFTNSNLLVTTNTTLTLSQVSSQNSCFYEQENSKIIVAGNVVNGGVINAPNAVNVHLFKKLPDPVDQSLTITTTNQSVTNTAAEVLYNTQAYAQRLALLVSQQTLADPTGASDPTSVINRKATLTRAQALEGYFKERLRKVPFAEVAVGGDSFAPYAQTDPVILGSGDTLRPVPEWNLPNGTALVGATSGPGTIAIVPEQLEATYPDPENPLTEEERLGDRVQVGNNLPAKRWDGAQFIELEPAQQVDGQAVWTGSTELRTRISRITQLADVGAADRAGFWEAAAAEKPKTAVDGVGGLRVVTGGGVYERVNSFLPPPTWVDATTGAIKTAPEKAADPYTPANTYDDPATTAVEQYPVVWQDTMPMSPVAQTGSQVYDNIAGSWTPWPGAVQPSQDPSWGTTIESATSKYAKGDLRMRATAVYHYANATLDNNNYDPGTPNSLQTPIACISSYYDPSTSSTGRNLNGLPDVSGQVIPGTNNLAGAQGTTNIGSNNGIVYPPPATARPGISATPGADGLLGGATPTELERQANYVFPNGRFANKPLRDALLKDPDNRTLADNAAIDATNCSLEILKGTLAPDDSVIPHGAIKEVAFLDGREIQAIDSDNTNTANVNETFTLSSTLAQPAQLTGNYDLALEERMPLEIRATVLDINVMREALIDQEVTTGPTPEYLLPDSGIIYATRDDALPDRSNRQPNATNDGIDEDTSKTLSPTDSQLDPTRRPNAIMLINGQRLFRGGGAAPAPVTTVEEVVREKGLTLVSNLPVYIKGEFNLHTKREFEDNTASFYDRSNLDENFACRQGDPRLPSCNEGDNWRPATVLGDAVTILTNNFREGFRNEGDFDLRNNAGAAAVSPRRDQGFYNNNFVTNGLSSAGFDDTGELGGTGTVLDDISYSGSPSGSTTGNGLNSSYFNNFVTPVQRRGNYPEYLMEVCTKLPVSACKEDDWFINPVNSTKASSEVGNPYTISANLADTINFKAGTTVDPPVAELQRFPRRVAFKRVLNTGATKNDLDDTPTDTKVTALGIGTSGNIEAVDTSNTSTLPRSRDNSLWFATATSATPYPAPNFGQTQPLFFLNAVTLTGTDGFELTDGRIQPPKITAATTPISPTTPTPALKHQPLLMPILQIQSPLGVPTEGTGFPTNRGTATEQAQNTRWVSQIDAGVASQELNLIVGAGDTPSRPGEFNGGLQNLPRFLEGWRQGGVVSQISGAFVQLNRSAYATAPLSHRLNDFSQRAFSPTGTAWYHSGYTIGNNTFSSPFFMPPGRNWGFDVGLLSQSPDLFTQKFTAPPTQTKPAEYFREVNRNDEWVKTLMCAVSDDGTDTAIVSSDLRPTTCP